MRPGSADGLVAREVGAWTAVVVFGALGLSWVTGAVESVRAGAVGLVLSALRAPEALVLLTPLLAALGAGLAAARMEGRGERVALEGAGYSPARSGLAAAAVGLGLGLLQWGVADHGLYRAQALAASLSGAPREGWVWLEGAAVHLADGARVEARAGELGEIRRLSPEALQDPALELARMAQRPRTASGEALALAPGTPARAERQARASRALGAAALALLGWLPWSRRPSRQVGVVLVLGLLWQLADFLLGALVARGQLPLAASWGSSAAVWLGLGLALSGQRLLRPGRAQLASSSTST